MCKCGSYAWLYYEDDGVSATVRCDNCGAYIEAWSDEYEDVKAAVREWAMRMSDANCADESM